MEKSLPSDRMRGRPRAIGVLSRRTGCSIDTIRYYERIGLMPRARRSDGGHRQYDEEDLRRLVFIRRSRELGLSLEQIGDLLGRLERRGCGCADVRDLLARQAAAVGKRIAELQRLSRNLQVMIESCGTADLTNCRLVDALLMDEHVVVGGCCAAPPE